MGGRRRVTRVISSMNLSYRQIKRGRGREREREREKVIGKERECDSVLNTSIDNRFHYNSF